MSETSSAAERVTVADIARAAGVSTATVSKVLNDRADVAPATRAMVRQLLSDQNYVRTARTTNSLKTRQPQHGGLIDIVFNDPGSPWAAEMIRGVAAAARSTRTSLVVSALDAGSSHRNRWLEDMTARGSLGVILAVSSLPEAGLRTLARLQVPVVLMDPVGDFECDLPSLGAGNWGGGLAATSHLIDLGHRRIGTITGPVRYLSSQARLAGYHTALERAGITPDPVLVRQGDFHYDSAVAGASALLDLPEPPTGIFAANDEQALGVYAAAQRRGIRIPEDLSVVGFDDVPMTQWVSPPLTTVRQPIAQLAELATRSLLGLDGGTLPPRGRIELPTSLIVRASTAPPRRTA